MTHSTSSFNSSRFSSSLPVNRSNVVYNDPHVNFHPLGNSPEREQIEGSTIATLIRDFSLFYKSVLAFEKAGHKHPLSAHDFVNPTLGDCYTLLSELASRNTQALNESLFVSFAEQQGYNGINHQFINNLLTQYRPDPYQAANHDVLLKLLLANMQSMRAKRAREAVIFMGQETAKLGQQPNGLDTEQQFNRIGDAFFRAQNYFHQQSQDPTSSNMNIAELYEAIETGEYNQQCGQMSGFVELDKVINGFAPGSINVIGALSGMGKTTLALNIATNVATNQSNTKPVLFFSLEMGKEQINLKVMSYLAQASVHDIQNKYINEEQNQRLKHGIRCLSRAELGNKPDMLIVDYAQPSIEAIMTKAQAYHNRYGGLSMIVVDYVQMIKIENVDPRTIRTEQLSQICTSLKSLAQQCGVPILLLAQVKQDVNYRPNDRTPRFGDVKDSSAIEHIADTVIFVDRKSTYKKNADPYGATLNVAKNRYGSPAEISLKFNGQYNSFYNAPRCSGFAPSKNTCANYKSSANSIPPTNALASSNVLATHSPTVQEPTHNNHHVTPVTTTAYVDPTTPAPAPAPAPMVPDASTAPDAAMLLASYTTSTLSDKDPYQLGTSGFDYEPSFVETNDSDENKKAEIIPQSAFSTNSTKQTQRLSQQNQNTTKSLRTEDLVDQLSANIIPQNDQSLSEVCGNAPNYMQDISDTSGLLVKGDTSVESLETIPESQLTETATTLDVGADTTPPVADLTTAAPLGEVSTPHASETGIGANNSAAVEHQILTAKARPDLSLGSKTPPPVTDVTTAAPFGDVPASHASDAGISAHLSAAAEHQVLMAKAGPDQSLGLETPPPVAELTAAEPLGDVPTLHASGAGISVHNTAAAGHQVLTAKAGPASSLGLETPPPVVELTTAAPLGEVSTPHASETGIGANNSAAVEHQILTAKAGPDQSLGSETPPPVQILLLLRSWWIMYQHLMQMRLGLA